LLVVERLPVSPFGKIKTRRRTPLVTGSGFVAIRCCDSLLLSQKLFAEERNHQCAAAMPVMMDMVVRAAAVMRSP
jgi:hypothetical protein